MAVKQRILGLPSALRAFVAGEAAGGLVLMAVAALALLIANSPLSASYFAALHAKVGGLSVLHWINDGLMAVFFLLVGLEIKREMVEGQLSTWRRRALPGLAALGGMLAPALVYLAFNLSEPAGLRGWAIPAATDIAFALGVLALLGPRAPGSLKIFLTALAIIDDLGAVAIIAVFYTSEISGPMLAGAGVTLAGLFILNRLGVARLALYMPLGLLLWFFTLKSGVHATVAGVLLALAIPLRASRAEPHREAPLLRMEHALHPWAAFFIVPVFGFANAGVSFSGVTPATLLQPVPLGVAAGLFIGKQVGVFGFALAAVKLGLAAWPRHASLVQVYGVALLCGIGFTMSLFIGALAFSDPAMQDQTKIGVLVGSLLSGLAGYALLRAQPAPERA